MLGGNQNKTKKTGLFYLAAKSRMPPKELIADQ